MRKITLSILAMLCMTASTAWADDFTVERAVNLGQLNSWADMSQFQWQEIDHGIQDNHEEVDALKALFYDPAPKDTVGFYNQIYKARDNQYIVLRLDKAQGKRPFYIRVTSIRSTTDPSQNTSKVYSAENYAYIMPPIGETQLEVKIWPQGEGEETAKTYTFHGHSYGSMSVRTMMLDKSRIVPGKYDLQLIRYDDETEKSDTTYISDLQPDKLYSFYTYDKGNLMEAYLRTNDFKRIKLKHEDWAMDAVTHVNDNSVMVMTGPKMTFRQHKRLDAPNPTYLDSRLFSHHDTLWVNLYLDNVPSNDADGLTMHPVLANFDNKPTGEQLLTWGKDPVSGRLYVLTDGEPCTIECYRDGYLPKLTMYPGSYDHITGIISGNSEETDIYLESIPAPVTSPTVTTAVLSTLASTADYRGGFYVTEIQQSDILPAPLTEVINYDEYGSHKDTLKFANGMMLEEYARMKVTIVAPYSYGTAGTMTLQKVHNAEENHIQVETLDGQKDIIYSHLWDYSYWTTDFDLHEYIPANKSGRPAIAFDGTMVRQLPILYNMYIDTKELGDSLQESFKNRINDEETTKAGNNWLFGALPNGALGLNAQIPIAPPFYWRWGFAIDFFKTKQLSVSGAWGAGIFYDVIKDKEMITEEKKGISVGALDDPIDISGLFNESNPSYDTPTGIDPIFKVNLFAEVGGKLTIPFTKLKSKTGWGQLLLGLDIVEEFGVKAEANATVGFNMDFVQLVAAIVFGQTGNSTAEKINDFYDGTAGRIFKQVLSPLQFSIAAGVKANASFGVYSFYNTTGSINPFKNHLLAFRVGGLAYLTAKLRAKLNLGIIGGEVGFNGGAGIDIKYAGGCRLDFRNGFSGSAYSWYAGLSAYYKAKCFGWSKSGSKELGRVTPKLELIKPKNFKNPFHQNFPYFMSDDDDPAKKAASRLARRAAVTLPGSFVTDLVDFTQPVKFIAGGDSIIYQGAYESPNDYCVEVASTGNPIYLSDYRIGGCTSYDAASIPGTDLVVLEQATAKIAQQDLTDSLHLDETVNRASRVYSVYYTKKHSGTKWFSPKPVYSSAETTSYKPRVALAEDGTGVAIWQEGLMGKGSWVAPEDTVQLHDLVMNGQLMLARFDGNETWSAPIPLMAVNESCALKDYSVTYDGDKAFIIARKVNTDSSEENICLTVDQTGNVTMHDIEQTNDKMQLRRVGSHNVLAWTTEGDTETVNTCFHVKSYDMDGKADKGINTSQILNNINVEDYYLVPDLQAKSLDNVALLWKETNYMTDSTKVYLRAARLVPNKDGSFGIGTPINAVTLDRSSSLYDFDGYMNNEKIQVCYVAVDSLGNSQLNKTAAYFGNAFGYTIAFDTDNNQGFQCNKDEITLLVTVNNYGTSTINECVLTVADKDYPLDMTIAAGSFAKERVNIPYIIGTGVNTTLRVKYDDVLGTQQQSYARYLARRAARLDGKRRADDSRKEDAVYEQQTQVFYPYHPRLECFVVAQRIDENGDNHITICLRNYARRQQSSDFAYVVGLKESANSSIVAIGAGEGNVEYQTKMVFNNPEDVKSGGGCMRNFGSYYAGYVTITVPNVTEKKNMYVGATVVLKDPQSGWYMQIVPDTRSICKNGAVTLYPSAEVVSVKNVYDNDDEGAHMRVSRQAGQLVVTGAEPGQQVRLYQASGVIMARGQADKNGRVTFTAPATSGVGLVSSDKETVKFAY